MKLIPVVYYGFTAMDRRFSSPMLPWIVSEIRKREYTEKLSLGVEDGYLQAYNADFEVQFAHRVSFMTRFSQADSDGCTFLYLLRDDAEQLLYCYLFQASMQNDVSELYQQMKDHSNTSAQAPASRPATGTSTLTSLCVDISPSSSNFFEVLYVGKIKVWHRKVPDTFIDDAIQKFQQHDLDKNRRKLLRLKSEMDLRRGSIDSTGSTSSGEVTPCPRLQRSLSLVTNLTIKSPDIDRKILKVAERITENGSEDEEKREKGMEMSEPATPTEEELDFVRLEKELLKTATDREHEHNRTMVLQVDGTDLRLISPDRKVILLHKQHKDVTTCIQGMSNSQHFGFISKEGNNLSTYIGYVFKCESTSVANEAVAAIRQAYNNPETKQIRPAITSCEQCPMVWFHKLCYEVENLSDRKTQAAIFRKIEQLDEEEQSTILTKFRGAETDSLREQNEFLMMLLRAHSEMKQGRHVHDTAENRTEFLNQYLGGGNTIFMKAKRSLSNSFDHLLKRRPSRDDFASSLKEMSLPVHTNHSSRETSPNPVIEIPENESEGFRSRSNTLGAIELKDTYGTLKDKINRTSPERCLGIQDKAPKSPMMDIFFKVGSNPKPVSDLTVPPKIDPASWRQAIFKRVVEPGRQPEQARQRTSEELRELWQKSIYQAILLVRMEKENARIRAKQEESAVKRIKLEYDEMRLQYGEEVTEIWDLIGNKDGKCSFDHGMLLGAIRRGIPRNKRGEVWQFMADRHTMKLPQVDFNKFPNFTVPYDALLKQLTSHQHAILIDLGRTFPAHSYYSSPLGPGQLALFNLLKAYSLLDPEVGYCQGLSFVAGVLLLHMEESQAFSLLRHLMYRRGLRNQYLPDMVGLQVKLYQLSRLLHDHLPDLYDHLDAHEVAPTLYAAPWLLTVFASQFPLGFVTRVFDLIFLEDTDVIFRVVLALLTLHKDSILTCDSFEDIMNYFKNKLPAINKDTLDKIMDKVYTTDISKQLCEYCVEYTVLQEEMQSLQSQIESFHKLEVQNRALTEQNNTLLTQLELALSNVQRLEKNRAIQQSAVNKLETRARTLEVTVATLGNFISTLVDSKTDLDIPGDVRRIISQLTVPAERRRSNSGNIFNMFKKNEANRVNPNKLMVKSLSTGKISVNNNNVNEEDTKSRRANMFFSNPHKDILEQKLLTEYESVSPTSSIDSGVGTPERVSGQSAVDILNNNNDGLGKTDNHHPLSNTDVNITYNTRELRKVKSIRDMSRNISPDTVK